jgi:hypothetical protein
VGGPRVALPFLYAAEKGAGRVSVRVEPCEWPLNVDCCSGAWDSASEEQREFARRVATELLWRLSGKRFGVCQMTVRPCRRSCAAALPNWPAGTGAYGAGLYTPILSGGTWLNTVCGSCKSDCGCDELCEVVLPGPVDSIVEVKVDGEIVSAAEYRVFDHRVLVGAGGRCWPNCQDLAAPDTEDGTFSVTYRQGIPVPPGGQLAAGVYACELVKSCQGVACRLPKRVTTLTREGVSMTFLDPMDFLDKGLTGVPEVDTWISAVNPERLRAGSRVYSPDVRPPRTVTS